MCLWMAAIDYVDGYQHLLNHINCNHKYDIWREGKTLQPQNTVAHKTIGNVRCGFQKMGKYIYSPNPVLIWFFPSFHWPIFTLYWWTTVKRGKLTIVNAWVKGIENVLHCFSNLHIFVSLSRFVTLHAYTCKALLIQFFILAECMSNLKKALKTVREQLGSLKQNLI